MTPFTPALPPDVRRGSAPPSILDKLFGLCPWFGLRPIYGHSPNEGHSPTQINQAYGGAEPRLTSGGKAGVMGSSFRSGF